MIKFHLLMVIEIYMYTHIHACNHIHLPKIQVLKEFDPVQETHYSVCIPSFWLAISLTQSVCGGSGMF